MAEKMIRVKKQLFDKKEKEIIMVDAQGRRSMTKIIEKGKGKTIEMDVPESHYNRYLKNDDCYELLAGASKGSGDKGASKGSGEKGEA